MVIGGHVADGDSGCRSWSAPRVPARAFPRPRLFERLTSWPDITVVHGPLGAGKTTLLASWVASLPSRAFWCAPVAGKLPLAELEVFAAAGGGVLVVDDGGALDPWHVDQLGTLIDRSPSLRVVIATSSARTAQIIAGATDTALDVISSADLLVTLSELREAGLFDDDEARLDVLRRSEGLAVAVRAALDDRQNRISGVAERLRNRLRVGLGDRSEAFIAALRIALLPRVDRAILAEWGITEETLEDIDRTGAVEWDGEWARIPSFIRSVLRHEAERLLPVETRHALITTAVRRSLIHRDPVQALDAAFEMEDLPLATEVVFASMIEILEARDEAYCIFQKIPASRLRGYPGLIVTLVLLCNMHPDTRPRALQLLAVESLFQRVQPNRGRHRERVVYRAFEAAALRLTPFSGRSLPLIRRAAEDFLALGEEDKDALGRLGPMLQAHLGISALYQGDLELAQRCFDIAYALHAQAGRADRVDPLSLRAGLAALSGDLPLARRLLKEADAAQWPPGWRTSSPADFFNLGMAIVAIEEGDHLAAQSHLDAAGPIVDIVEHWTIYALEQARCDRLANDIDVGLMRLQRLREQRGAAPGGALARSLLDAAEAELLLAAGRTKESRDAANRSAKHSTSCRIALARAELSLGRISEAALHARRVLAVRGQTPRHRLEAELILACSALRSDNQEGAVSVANRIAELIHLTGMRAPLRTITSNDRQALVEVFRRSGRRTSLDAAVALVETDTLPREDVEHTAIFLTPRERDVLQALAHVTKTDDIAVRMFVSRNTVKTHLRSVYRKLGVSSREAALTRAVVLGLLDISSE